ncbi:TIGR02300 family protein [Inquilinus limosus]|uniref:TIGR02300 family protein n=1 Tax=Inquilinus limosus TaxID=171674 RepID=A0A211Z7V8_9PROT|nr:TIGR02300 family protein [Inquilinus limosus]OWJ61359.1 TIGR02300 family protein [Inquilinus limosus]
MAKPEWGAKRICHNCGARYYDLQRDPIICPKCGTEYDPEAFLKSRRSRSIIVDEPVEKVRAAKNEDSDALLEDETEEESGEDEESAEEVEVLDEGDLDDTATGEDEDDEASGKDKGSADEFDAEEDLGEDQDVLIEDADDLGEEDVDVEIEDDGEERNR